MIRYRFYRHLQTMRRYGLLIALLSMAAFSDVATAERRSLRGLVSPSRLPA